MERIIALDWETYYDNVCTVKELGNWAYAHHPDFEAYMVSLFDGDRLWAGHPSEAPWDWVNGATLLSHNAAFDINVYIAEVEKGNVPSLDIPAWHCTANMSVYLCGFRDLKRSSERLLGPEMLQRIIGRKSVSKAMRGSAKGMRYQDFLREKQWEAMCEYAGDDVILCWHLWDRFSSRFPALERMMSGQTIARAVDGAAINWDLVNNYSEQLNNAMLETRAELPWVAEGKPETSPIAIKDHCARCGIPVPPVKDSDEEGYNKWVEMHSKTHKWVPLISEFRKLNKMAAFLRRLQERRRPDGTIESTILYFGGHTGRWAGALGEDQPGRPSSGINLQNLRREPLKVGDIDINQRAVFVPKNDKFIIADYAQIEARVTNWLVGNDSLLDQVRRGISVYEAHARDTMGWTGGDLKKEDNKMYQLAKARVLMLGYGAGWKKFRDTAYKMLGLRIEDKVARDTVRDFRAKNPLLKGFWKARDIEITEAGRQKPPANVYVYKMKSGRCLVYNNVLTKMCQVEVPDYEADPEGLKMKAVLMPQSTAVVNGFQTRHFYGGKITENIVQATARDIFAEGLRRCYQKGWHVPFHVHDEVILDVPKSVAIEEAIEALSFCPEWAEGCPVDIEAHEADHYLK